MIHKAQNNPGRTTTAQPSTGSTLPRPQPFSLLLHENPSRRVVKNRGRVALLCSPSNPATTFFHSCQRDGEGEARVHLHQARVGCRDGILLREAQEPSSDHGEARVQEVRPSSQQARSLHGSQDEVSAIFAGRDLNNTVE